MGQVSLRDLVHFDILSKIIEMDWTQLLTTLLSGGTVIYLIVDKLFSRRKDNAEAHGSMVVSFDKEMDSLRKIRLDMIEDVQKMREQLKLEHAKAKESISGEVGELRNTITELKHESANREAMYMKQFVLLNTTIQKQAVQINKMTMYWQLLCDRDCSRRHVPTCPLTKDENESEATETI